MTNNEYLNEVLASQDLAEDSPELKELREHRKDVEDLLNEKFAKSSPTIRYGGSKAKGTLIREYYDLDLVCYFPHDETSAGETLKEIYENVRDALKEKYAVQEKTSAIRLRSKDSGATEKDIHIDVVPGRYVADEKADCFLHQTQGDKERLKTNLQIHIDHVRGSGVTNAIRLLKLWKVRRGLSVKQFVFELLIIKLLADKKGSGLAEQVEHVWTKISEAQEAITVEDPANPTGNDLMPVLRGSWGELSGAAASSLRTLDSDGWEGIYGPVKTATANVRVERLAAAAAAVKAPSRPWYPHA